MSTLPADGDPETPGGKADSIPDEDDLTKLETLFEGTASVAEPSGIAIRWGWYANEALVVGDSSFSIAVAPITDSDSLSFESHDLTGLLPSPHESSQWEAVAVDALDRVFVLEEQPGAVYVFSPTLDALEHTIELDVPGGDGWRDDLEKDWEDEPNSRGEGMVLGSAGHLFVLKEKQPPLIVEFGPEQDAALGFVRGEQTGYAPWFDLPEGPVSRYVPLAVWQFRGKVRDLLTDMSDMTVGVDGHLYVISGEQRVLARIDDDLDPDDDDKLSVDLAWKLPKRASNPEGLAAVGPFEFMVVSDQEEPPDLFYFWAED